MVLKVINVFNMKTNAAVEKVNTYVKVKMVRIHVVIMKNIVFQSHKDYVLTMMKKILLNTLNPIVFQTTRNVVTTKKELITHTLTNVVKKVNS